MKMIANTIKGRKMTDPIAPVSTWVVKYAFWKSTIRACIPPSNIAIMAIPA